MVNLPRYKSTWNLFLWLYSLREKNDFLKILQWPYPLKDSDVDGIFIGSPYTSVILHELPFYTELSWFSHVRLSVCTRILSFWDNNVKFCTRPFFPKKLLIYRNRSYRTTIAIYQVLLCQTFLFEEISLRDSAYIIF